MLRFNADPRDGVPQGNACDTCCCQPVQMRPGETNLIEINYAPWSMQIGNPGIIHGIAYNFELNADACDTSLIEGFTPPTHTNQLLTTPLNTPLVIDLTTGVGPDAANIVSYELVPFSGPSYGGVEITALGEFTYTPATGWTGRDYFSFEVTDAQNRTVIRHVEVTVGDASPVRQLSRLSLAPYVDISKVVTNHRSQIVRIPLYMPFSVKPCERYKLTISQKAQDCDGVTFNHFMCLDVTSKPCG